jgi:hypothetical protein
VVRRTCGQETVEDDLNYTLVAVIGCVALFLGMVLVSLAAYRLGRRRLAIDSAAPESSGAITGAIFALLGLLMAFTFNGAYSRLDARRQLIVQEANAIGTAYLRLDLLPAEVQAPLREAFREYAAYRAAERVYVADSPEARSHYAKTAELQNEIWAGAVAASGGPEHQSARMLLMAALNQMIDIVTTRSVAIQTHPPLLIWIALSVIALACAGMAGYSASSAEHPKYYYFIAFAAIIAFTLYIILEMEYPRYGLVRLDQVNQVLIDLAESMR